MARRALAVLLFVLAISTGFAQKAMYLQEIKKAVEAGWQANPRIIKTGNSTSRGIFRFSSIPRLAITRFRKYNTIPVMAPARIL